MDRATHEAEGLGFADDHGIRSALGIVHARPQFARKVAAICDKWRVVEG
jgi:hypothetical protein